MNKSVRCCLTRPPDPPPDASAEVGQAFSSWVCQILQKLLRVTPHGIFRQHAVRSLRNELEDQTTACLVLIRIFTYETWSRTRPVFLMVLNLHLWFYRHREKGYTVKNMYYSMAWCRSVLRPGSIIKTHQTWVKISVGEYMKRCWPVTFFQIKSSLRTWYDLVWWANHKDCTVII